jgi:GNAT superfamily N-acetyltransferase
MVTLRIEALDPQDRSAVQDVVDVYAAAGAVDRPWHPRYSPDFIRVLATYGWDDVPQRFFLGRTPGDGTAVVAGSVVLPTRDNRQAAAVVVHVVPDQRGRRFGSALYDHLEMLAADAGRTRLFTGGPESASGRRFIERRGYALAFTGVDRHVDLTKVSAQTVQSAFDEAAAVATDYELVRLAGPLPGDLVDAYAEAASAINDAPLDDLDIDDEVFDADRVRHYERSQLMSGRRLYRVLAQHRSTGAIAGHTVVAVEPDPSDFANQHDTTVVGAHRGHRLGLLLKADMMRWLRDVEPQLRTLATQNAASNSHMIAVNERLCYRVLGRSTEFQRDLEAPVAASPRGAGSVTATA